MRGGGDVRHVVQRAGAVVDLGEHQHRHVGLQALQHLVRLDQLERAAALAAQGLGDVQVGGEVAAFADHHAARAVLLPGDGQRGRQRLVEVDRGGVGGHHLAGLGADPGAMRSPTRRGRANQPALFQLVIKSRPHCWATTAATRAGTARGCAPSELPSR
jgi:hypothetical protein